jgi:hypothetical protein
MHLKRCSVREVANNGRKEGKTKKRIAREERTERTEK